MSEDAQRLTANLADRYQIERELTRGRTTVDYLARELKHDRSVVVKVLVPGVTARVTSERFLRELRTTARLQHPHIQTVLDSGEADGFLYYVTPYFEDESLLDRLDRVRQLPIDEAVHIAQDVASALVHAHGHGVLHLGLRPRYIVLAGRDAVVAGFGVMHAIGIAGGDDQMLKTRIAIGNPAYMSPEQMSGEVLDGRTDIYALGCVLFQMLAGEPPFGTGSAAMAARLVADAAPDVRDSRRLVPEPLAAVVAKALAKTPADRFDTPAALANALVGATASRAQAPDPPSVRSIAILPFTNMSDDEESEYFSDGMTEEIINALVQVPTLHVAAKTSSFAFRNKRDPPRVVGERLNVGTIVEGSVRKTGTKLRVTAQLVNVSDGMYLWSERYDREIDDVFAVQDEIAGAIVDTLKIKLGDGGGIPASRRGTADMDAYHSYLKGRHFWNRRDAQRAMDSFQHAAAVDPNYAAAHAGLADAYCVLGFYGFMPGAEALAQARAAAQRAIELDDELVEGHYSKGLAEMYFGWDLDVAETEFQRAIALNPHFATAQAWLAFLYAMRGRDDEAVAAAERAYESEPLSPLINVVVGFAHFFAGRRDRAMEAAQRALEIDSTFPLGLWVMGQLYTQQSEYDQAIEALKQCLEQLQQSAAPAAWLAYTYVKAGRPGWARTMLDGWKERLERGEYLPALPLGYVHFFLNEPEEAFEWLAKAFDERDGGAWFPWPGLESCQTDPRFVALLAKYGLEGGRPAVG